MKAIPHGRLNTRFFDLAEGRSIYLGETWKGLGLGSDLRDFMSPVTPWIVAARACCLNAVSVPY